jgi:hypothetical protein
MRFLPGATRTTSLQPPEGGGWVGPEVTGARVEVAFAVALGVAPDRGRAVGVPVRASTDGGGTDAVTPVSPAGVGIPSLSPSEVAGTGVKVAGTLVSTVSTGGGSAPTAEGVAEAAVSTDVGGGVAGKTDAGVPVEATGVAVGTGSELPSQPHRHNAKSVSNAVRAPTLLFTRGRGVEGEGRVCPAASSRATGIATGGRGRGRSDVM